MLRVLLSVALLPVVALPVQAQAAKDTQGAAATRKKLQTKINVDFKDTRLVDCTKELKQLLEDAGGGSISFQFALGVSMNLTVTYAAKEQTVADILDGMFQKNGLGYVVISQEKDRYDGWVQIKQGKERGYPLGTTPVAKPLEKPKTIPPEKPPIKEKPPVSEGDKAEQIAAARLSLAKDLFDAGKTDRAKERLQEIIKLYPTTKAAEEAKKLLGKIKS